ncbi:MAG: glycosyltransferase family 4 protein, partial [Bacteroidota bacterium]
RKNLRSFVIPWPKLIPLPGHYLRASYQYSSSLYQKFIQHSLDADFIYAKGFAAWRLQKERAKGLKTAPLGIKFHGYEMFQVAANWKVKLQQYLLKGPARWNSQEADFVFSYGGKITDIIMKLGIPRDKILEFATGIEADWLTKEVSPPRERKSFVFLGRYERRKGIEELMQILPNLLEEHKVDVHFIGPIPNHLQFSHPQVQYHGKLMEKEKIQHILRRSDVLLCPSHSEGMPNVIMEAMASGLYIIASDVGACSTLVSEENGKLIRPIHTEDLKAAIEEVIRMDDAELMKKKQNSLEKVRDRFLWPEIIQQILTEIEKISSNSLAIS